MAILSKGTDFSTGDQVTAAKLDALVDDATFASDAVDGSTTALDTNGKIIVKDLGVAPSKISTGGPAWTNTGQVKLINSKSDISDFWGATSSDADNGAAVFTPFGFLGSNGSFAVSLFSNGYRNASGGFTSLGVDSNSTASGIDLLPTGNILFRGGTPSGTSIPEIMRIASSGKVGIGVSSPDEALTVKAGDFGSNQDGGIAIQLGLESENHFKSAFKCKTDSSGVPRAAIDAPLSSSGGTTQEVLSLDHTGAGLPRVGIGNTDPSSILDITQATGAAEINLNATANDAVLSLNSDTNENQDSEIHFNAGTNTRGKIEYNHHVTAASQKMSFFAGDNNERLTILGDGNVGIGTTSPSKLLSVVSPNTATAETVAGFGNQNIATGLEIITNGGTSSLEWGFNAVNSRSLVFNTNQTERMKINSSGTVSIVGALSKGSGSFKIDHPIPEKKDTHHLVHSFVESPQADNIYRGKVNLVGGTATINIDMEAGMTEGTFVLLNRDIQCFSSNESGWTAVKASVSGNLLTITAQDDSCTDTIS